MKILQLPFTINSELISHSQLKSLLGAQLTRNLYELLPEMYAEVLEYVNELVQSEGDGMCISDFWFSVVLR